MKTKEAYDAVCRAIEADPHKRIVKQEYEEEIFGNFIVAFEEHGQQRSIVNDRFELVICDDAEGEQCRTVLQSIREADEAAILDALGL